MRQRSTGRDSLVPGLLRVHKTAQLPLLVGLLPGQGLYVKKVGEKGLGTMIGIKAGEVILEINERPARDIAEFKAAVSEAEKDRPVRFKIKRGESKIFAAYQPK